MDKNQNDGIKIEAKVSKDIIDGLSTDIVQRYDQKFSKIEKNGLNYYIVLTIMTCLIAIFILESNFDIYLKEKIVTSAEFNSRELLGQSPQLSSKIKILVKDDTTVSYMKKPFFSTNEWADLLKFVANYKPKAIYIDKLFAFIDPKSEKAIKKIASIDIPIYIMASIRRQKKVSGQNLDLGGNFYRPNNYFHQTLQDEEKQKFLKVSKFLPRENSKHIYSSNLGYRNLFISASTDYFSLRYFHPLLIVDSHSILPHLGIAGANNINLYPDQILINGNDLGLSNQKALARNLFRFFVWMLTISISPPFSFIKHRVLVLL